MLGLVILWRRGSSAVVFGIAMAIAIGMLWLSYFLRVAKAKGMQLPNRAGMPELMGGAVALLCLVLLISPLSTAAQRSSADVYSGKTQARASRRLIDLVLGIKPRPVRAIWTQGQAPAGFPVSRDSVYLGESDGIIVIYDATNHEVYRVSSGSVLLHSQPDHKL
jgi:hypothetical protein